MAANETIFIKEARFCIPTFNTHFKYLYFTEFCCCILLRLASLLQYENINYVRKYKTLWHVRIFESCFFNGGKIMTVSVNVLSKYHNLGWIVCFLWISEIDSAWVPRGKTHICVTGPTVSWETGGWLFKIEGKAGTVSGKWQNYVNIKVTWNFFKDKEASVPETDE